MDGVLQAVMDAIQALQKVQEMLEDRETAPVVEQSKNGVTTWHRCRCGHPLVFGKKYCSECGRKIRWDA